MGREALAYTPEPDTPEPDTPLTRTVSDESNNLRAKPFQSTYSFRSSFGVRWKWRGILRVINTGLPADKGRAQNKNTV